MQDTRAWPHAEVASAIDKVRASNSKPVVKLAFEFLVLTAVRGGEVRRAAWTEIDLDHGVWTILAPRTKTNREHRVPPSCRALEILGEARTLSRAGGPLVFPMRGNPLSNTAMSRLLKRLGIGAVPHGFRSSFRDWAAEETDHPREVAEATLAHVVRNQVEAAYRRTDLFERRRRLMDDWAAYFGCNGRERASGGISE
ncbi:tyrosine-type recombinase/integrase [Candidatus Palauibacter sp.]|uniref:tyrosine-type recombinase/integrase n=1 Tax=Candidatus Palauibacter sp. TaxID=3101350 RepID=UPI003B01331B